MTRCGLYPRRLGSSKTTKGFFQRLLNKLADVRYQRRARPGHIENFDPMFCYKGAQSSGRMARRSRQVQEGLVKLSREMRRRQRSAGQFLGDGKNGGAIRVAHVPKRPLRVFGGGRLLQLIFGREG